MIDELGDHPIKAALRPGENVRALVRMTGSLVLVTDERVAVAADERIALNLATRELRRIQFDIERDRPATLVIVPELPTHEPQVLAVPPEHYEAVGAALAVIGRQLYGRSEA